MLLRFSAKAQQHTNKNLFAPTYLALAELFYWLLPKMSVQVPIPYPDS